MNTQAGPASPFAMGLLVVQLRLACQDYVLLAAGGTLLTMLTRGLEEQTVL
jgi:hypothetical protein